MSAAIKDKWLRAKILSNLSWIWWLVYFLDFHLRNSWILGSSFDHNSRSWWKFELISAQAPSGSSGEPENHVPLNGKPCLARKMTFCNSIRRYAQLISFSFWSSVDRRLPTSANEFEAIWMLYLWTSLFSWTVNPPYIPLTSFQFE